MIDDVIVLQVDFGQINFLPHFLRLKFFTFSLGNEKEYNKS